MPPKRIGASANSGYVRMKASTTYIRHPNSFFRAVSSVRISEYLSSRGFQIKPMACAICLSLLPERIMIRPREPAVVKLAFGREPGERAAGGGTVQHSMSACALVSGASQLYCVGTLRRRTGRQRCAVPGRSVFDESRRAAVIRQATDLKELRRLQPIVFLLHLLRLFGVWLRHDFLQLSN